MPKSPISGDADPIVASHGHVVRERVALGVGLRVEEQPQRFDLRGAEARRAVGRRGHGRARVGHEALGARHDVGEGARPSHARERRHVGQTVGLAEALHEGARRLVDLGELAPLGQDDRPAHDREDREEREDRLGHRIGREQELPRRPRCRPPDLRQHRPGHAEPPRSLLAKNSKVRRVPSARCHLRAPAEFALRLPDVDHGAKLLARARRGVLHRNVGAGPGLQRRRKFEHRGLDAGSDVVGSHVELRRLGELRFGGGEIGARHVAGVHIVARLHPFTEHRQRFSLEDAVAEDRDHAGFAVRILSRAVDVGVAQGNGVEAVDAGVIPEVVLHRQLGDPVGRLGILGHRLDRRHRHEVAVDRAAGRGEDDARRVARRAHRLQQVERADDVDRRVEHRIVDALAHVDLRGEMTEDVELSLAHQRRRLGRADVGDVQRGSCRDVLALA